MAKSERSKLVKHSEGIDRISSLPEPLLSHILSLLPTKYAVATSLLSTRWRFLWTSITNLNFDDEEALSTCPKKSLNKRRKKFAYFVTRVLLQLNPPCIHNFQLKCHQQPCDPFYLDSWICAAIGRTVQKLELHLVLDQPMELPMSHFHCRTLAVLKMNGDIHFNIFASASICFPNLLTLHLSQTLFTIASNCSISFPSLKDLLLDSVKYTNEESVHKLFASCSVLDNLVIKRSDLDNAPSLIISIPSLRSLTIHFGYFYSGGLPSANAYKLQIDAPVLKYLYVEDGSKCFFTSDNLFSLLEARIEINVYSDTNSYQTNIFKFIGGMFNAKFLSISGRTLKVISSISANITPIFRNLTRLELSRYTCRDWSVVLKNFLESLCNLEHLVSEGMYYRHESESWWMEPLRVPICLLRRVTTISFTGTICGCKDELELIRYFLKHAKVLKKLTIDGIDGSDGKKLKLMQKILMSPRDHRNVKFMLMLDIWSWNWKMSRVLLETRKRVEASMPCTEENLCISLLVSNFPCCVLCIYSCAVSFHR